MFASLRAVLPNATTENRFAGLDDRRLARAACAPSPGRPAAAIRAPASLGQPRRAGAHHDPAGAADAADVQHGVRGRGPLPVRRPPGDPALPARRGAAGRLPVLLLRRAGALPGARRAGRQHRRARRRAGAQPARDAGGDRPDLRDEQAAVQRAGRPVRGRPLRGDRAGPVPRPPGHLRRHRAVPPHPRDLAGGAVRGPARGRSTCWPRRSSCSRSPPSTRRCCSCRASSAWPGSRPRPGSAAGRWSPRPRSARPPSRCCSGRRTWPGRTT